MRAHLHNVGIRTYICYTYVIHMLYMFIWGLRGFIGYIQLIPMVLWGMPLKIFKGLA